MERELAYRLAARNCDASDRDSWQTHLKNPDHPSKDARKWDTLHTVQSQPIHHKCDATILLLEQHPSHALNASSNHPHETHLPNKSTQAVTLT